MVYDLIYEQNQHQYRRRVDPKSAQTYATEDEAPDRGPGSGLVVGAHGYETYREAARIYRSGRARGISLTTIDTLNAAIEPEHGASVFTLHRDSSRMARIYKLVLYQF
jgi:hypothetical protein